MANNNLSIGSLSTVAWTDMNGTGLSPADLVDVNAEITAALALAGALLGAINSSINLGQSQFALYSRTGAAPDYLRLVSDPTVASDHAALILRATGIQVADEAPLSLSQWRRVAAGLEDYAALQISKRDPYSATSPGGIKNSNGHWYVNGQEVSLLDVYMAVRVNQVANFDDSLNVYIEELNANNRLVKAANEWLNVLRAKKPADSTGTGAAFGTEISDFSSKWGISPTSTFHPSNSLGAGNVRQTVYDGAISGVTSYVEAKDTENQIAQQKLEQMTNRRSEVLEGLTSFVKAQSQTGQSFARNLG